MRSGFRHIVLFFFILGFSQEARTQMIFDTLFLDEAEIIADRYEQNSPLKTEEIDTLVKAEMDYLNLAGLLSSHTPVFVKDYGPGSLSTASFRGTAATHTKVLWNDFQINSPMLGQVDLSLVPNNFYTHAILNYGGSSIENVTGALGGAVNLLSDSYKQEEKISLIQTVGSFKTFSTSLNLDVGNQKFRSVTRAQLNSSDNSFRFYNNAIIPPEWQLQEDASYYNRGFTQSFSFGLTEEQEMKLITWNQWNFRQIPPLMSNQDQNNKKEEQRGFISRNVFQWKLKKNQTLLDVKAAWFYEDLYYQLITVTSVDPEDTVTYIHSVNTSNTGFAKANLTKFFGKDWTLSAGLNMTLDRVQSNNYDGKKERNDYGLFLKMAKTFSRLFRAEVLLRQQFVDGTFTPPAPFAGISVRPVKEQQLYIRFNASYNYNLPSLNDLYWYPGGNPGLQPESGFQYEGGVSYFMEFSGDFAFSIDLSAYNSHIYDWIQWVPTDYRYWTANNIGLVHARGLEAKGQVFGQGRGVTYKVTVNYAYTKSTNQSEEAEEGGYAGRQLIYVPLQSGNVFAHVTVMNFEFSWNTQFTGKRNTSLGNGSIYSNVLPAYALTSVSAGKTFHIHRVQLAVKFKVNNLFNKEYQAVLWRAMPGINYELLAVFKWK